MILKIDDNTFIEYEPITKRSTVLDLNSLNTELEFCEEKLAEIPPPTPDEELLRWAKENYPAPDYSEQLRVNTERKEEITRILNEINAL